MRGRGRMLIATRLLLRAEFSFLGVINKRPVVCALQAELLKKDNMQMRSRIAIGLMCVMTYGFLIPAAFAVTRVTGSAKIEQVRTGLSRIGTGEDTRVAVRLRNGSRLKGYLFSADTETFSVADLKTGIRRTVGYSDVAQIRAQNLTGGQKFAIGSAIIIALLLALVYAARGN